VIQRTGSDNLTSPLGTFCVSFHLL
jgi:hypothetical protein